MTANSARLDKGEGHQLLEVKAIIEPWNSNQGEKATLFLLRKGVLFLLTTKSPGARIGPLLSRKH